jgi:hypothetical protein
MRGVRSQTTKPLPDIAIKLDGTRTARTDAGGAYAFDNVAPGTHRIAAQLPESPRAFFTTPSFGEAKVHAHVDFGLVWAAARIEGRVIGDDGTGIQGAVLSATAEKGLPITATSDAQGLFVFVVPPGRFRLSIAEESLTAGYSIADPRELVVTVEAGQPQSATFNVRVRRSIAGLAAGAYEVRIESLGMTARVDPDGNFLFRSMPAGTFVLVARVGGMMVTRTVTLSAEPMIERSVDFGARPAAASSISPALLQVRSGATFHVQAGAFRLHPNAALARQRIERMGIHAVITRSGGLDLVMTGPFASREAAGAEVARFAGAGIAAVVVTDRLRLAVSNP